MSEFEKKHSSTVNDQEETDVIGLLKRMQQQLAFLEKKIDILVNAQAEGASRGGGRPFSKPSGFRPDRGPRRDFRGGGFHKGQGQGQGREREHGQARPFEPRQDRGGHSQGQPSGGFRKPKKHFFRKNG